MHTNMRFLLTARWSELVSQREVTTKIVINLNLNLNLYLNLYLNLELNLRSDTC